MNTAKIVHSYYVAPTGRMFGILPNTGGAVICIQNAVAFNPDTRMLQYDPDENGDMKYVILPADKAEQSKNPDFCEKTKIYLSKLDRLAAAAAINLS